MEEVAPQLPPGGVDQSREEEAHPLENPVVLGRLFELIPFKLKDFRNFRLVSRAWHALSLSTWRQNAKLALLDKEPEKKEDQKRGGISRQKYLELVENDQYQLVRHPFRKYLLENWEIDLQSANQDGDHDQLRFWNRVGNLMTHLDLRTCKFVRVQDLRTVIFEATSNLQNLTLILNHYVTGTERPASRAERLDPKLPQHASIPPEQVQNNLHEFDLHFHFDEDEEGEDDGNELPAFRSSRFSITWMEFFIHFPNIKQFGGGLAQSTGFYLDTEAEFLEIFETVGILRRERGPHYLANLNDLDLWEHPAGNGFGREFFSTINRLRFPFKKLQFEVDSTVDELTFKQLLQHPLESLIVGRQAFSEGPFPNFPFGLHFAALKDLCMMGPIAPNLLFLRECPNLEEFWYVQHNVDGFDANLTVGLTDGSTTMLEKLTRLRIMNYLFTAEDVRKSGELMPNVKNLHIGLDDGSFLVVCEVWKELQHLTINPCRVGEKALLGVDEQSGEKFRHPNLTDLKKLKFFAMEDVEDEEFELTEAGILDGIMALPNLEWVSVSISSEIPPEVCNRLTMKIPKCQLIIRQQQTTIAAEQDEDN